MSADRYGAFEFERGTASLETLKAAISEIIHAEGNPKVDSIEVESTETTIRLVLKLKT